MRASVASVPGARKLCLALSAFFAASRLLLYLVGVRYHADYAWQHFHDLDLLTDRLWETLLYTHAFTPFMDLFVGVAHKLAGDHAPVLYQAVYLGLGLAFTLSVGYLLLAVGFGVRAAFAVAALFACTPAFIYFETFLHYEFPAAALLCVSVVLLHRALTRDRPLRFWLAFFFTCALIAFIRTTFHLVWLAAMLVVALAFQRRAYRAILAAAVLPLALVVGLYAKNQVLFGFFGTSSWFGFNLAIVTTERMDRAERMQWIQEGRLHPVTGVPLYSGVRAYKRWVDLERKTGIPVLDRKRRANGEPNYNHYGFIEVSKLRMQDDRYVMRERPRDYARTVLEGYVDYFRPTTRWHPFDAKRSPHNANRVHLAPWENAYNTAVHTLPFAPAGLYAPLLALLFYALGLALVRLWRARLEGCVEEKLVLVMIASALYVPVLSCLVTIGELERYRFMVEAFMWICAAWAGKQLFAGLAAGRTVSTA